MLAYHRHVVLKTQELICAWLFGKTEYSYYIVLHVLWCLPQPFSSEPSLQSVMLSHSIELLTQTYSFSHFVWFLLQLRRGSPVQLTNIPASHVLNRQEITVPAEVINQNNAMVYSTTIEDSNLHHLTYSGLASLWLSIKNLFLKRLFLKDDGFCFVLSFGKVLIFEQFLFAGNSCRQKYV